MLKDGRKLVALLPMKAHSERVPGKNFREFAGKPLFRWMLDRLCDVAAVDNIVINTDARTTLESLGVPGNGKVLLRDRRPEICGDGVSMNVIIGDDMENVPADIYLMTHTTNPLLERSTMERALEVFVDDLAAGTHDSLFTVNRFQTRFYRRDGSPVNHNPAVLARTQDLEPWFEENSNLYLFTPASFAASGARIGARPRLFEMPKPESIDIDNEEDWRIAEALAMADSSREKRDNE